MYCDSHIHITHRLYDGSVPCLLSEDAKERVMEFDRKQLVEYLKKQNIAFVVEPGINVESNQTLLDFSAKYPDYIYPAIGVHPTRAPQEKWKNRREIERLSLNERVVAIGELGLDYHYERKGQHRHIQKKWFIWQLKLAHKRQLPLILHIRLADKDAIRILRRHHKKIHGGVCHCFNRGPKEAKIYTEEFGFMLGIGASLLQKNATELEQTVRDIPLEYLILETDGPYVKPQKPDTISGKQWNKIRNSSLIIPDVAKRVAELKGIDVSEVERVTTENTKHLFGIMK